MYCHRWTNCNVRHLGPDLIGDVAPLLACRLGVVLGEGGGDEGRDDPPALLAGMGQGVPHEVDAAALPGGAEHLRDRGLDAFMAVGDDQFHPAQAAAGELAQVSITSSFDRASNPPRSLSWTAANARSDSA
jgi:hypothetical protein